MSVGQHAVDAATGAATGIVSAVRRPWPKLHLIYFLLAVFDLVAVGGGLYLSHQLSSIYESSVATNDEWNRRYVEIWKLGDLAFQISAPAVNVFQSKQPVAERLKLNAATEKLSGAVDAIRGEISSNVPQTLASHPLKTLTYIDQALSSMAAHGDRTLAEFEKGNIEQATHAMALTGKSLDLLKRRLDESAQSVREIQTSYASRYAAMMEAMRRFEYIIGGAIFLMVCGVVTYGHWVGSFMSRKYRELQAAHDAAVRAEAESKLFAGQVQAINGDVIKLNRDLESNLAMLRDAQDELVRKGRLAQLGQLTATVAHEIRNPLGAVRTAVYVVERRIKDKGLGIEPQMQRIANGVTRCDNIITQLLEFSRTRALQTEPTVVDNWLAALVEEEAGRLPQSITVDCSLELGQLKSSIDPARLSRAVINLVHNAAEAMVGKGDEPVNAGAPEPQIAIVSALTARGIEISIADSGPGIRPEHLEKIREPLFTTKSFGTGLGIPAVEQIVGQHGGKLEIASKPGQGAVFTIILPHRAGETPGNTQMEAV